MFPVSNKVVDGDQSELYRDLKLWGHPLEHSQTCPTFVNVILSNSLGFINSKLGYSPIELNCSPAFKF